MTTTLGQKSFTFLRNFHLTIMEWRGVIGTLLGLAILVLTILAFIAVNKASSATGGAGICLTESRRAKTYLMWVLIIEGLLILAAIIGALVGGRDMFRDLQGTLYRPVAV